MKNKRLKTNFSFDKLYFTAKISSNNTVDYKPCAGENEKLANNTFVFNFEEDSLIKLNIKFKSDANNNFGENERFKFTVIPSLYFLSALKKQNNSAKIFYL